MEFSDTRELNHEQQVLNHLKAHGKISPLQALRSYSCLRLAAVIHRLRKRGHSIETDWRKQGKSRYAVYRLENGQDRSESE